MADAMATTGLPYIISFMLRKEGCFIDGTRLNDAIYTIDNNVKRIPLCYMSNCIHPTIIRNVLSFDFNQNESVRERFRGFK
jgi:S-methylmethionine-dependent homocysteine/selenocysteine methylase